jgi:predicted anti-sigma-YlaC factor YlaD
MLPGVIKRSEAKLAKDSGNQKLILETGSYYVMYANAFVQEPAFMLPKDAYEERDAEYRRAREMFLRGAEILEDGLERKYPGIMAQAAALDDSVSDTSVSGTSVFRTLTADDVPYIYWLAAGLLSAYSIEPLDLSVGMRVGGVLTLARYAYTLAPDFNEGALDGLFLIYYASIPEGMGRDMDAAKRHYKAALEKSRYLAASPYVSWAQAVCIPAQDYRGFRDNLEAALAIKSPPSNRLVNILAQRKARFLLDNAENYFILFEP